MLNVIAPGAVSSAANPLLDFWAQAPIVDGNFTYLAPALPHALSFQIFDVRDPDAPAQIFPVSVGTKQAVNFTTDRIDGLVGHYAAAWTCSVIASKKGRYQIRWFYTPTDGAVERVTMRDFDVIPAAEAVPMAGLGYVIPSDMRDEGVTPSMSTDAQLIRRIDLASRYIERVTGRFFSPTYKTIQVRADESRPLFLGEPMIALARVTIGDEDLERDTFRVANRHLASNLTSPDDRVLPTLDLWTTAGASAVVPTAWPVHIFGTTATGGSWRFGTSDRIVTLRGLFGFTDFDGSPTGRTPLLIQQAAKLIVMRELPGLGSEDREDAQRRNRLTSERTRDQSYTLSAPRVGAITGDADIDDLLQMFMRPISVGVA